VRLFEWNITIPSLADTADAARIIQLTKFNYGHAGRVFAKWIAINLTKTDKIVCSYKEGLVTHLCPQQNERFLIAGMACVMAGARIANHLGLCKFDLDALYAFMVAEFLRMRDERASNTTISAAGIDVEQIFSQFMADRSAHKLVTTRFAHSGAGRGWRMDPREIKWEPTDRRRVDIHISQSNPVIRVSRNVFQEWCRDRGYPPAAVTKAMEQQWHAMIGRHTLAAGTGYAPGKMFCIDIPAVNPPLSEYLLLTQQTAPAGAATPGNQPRV
jgi:hypothetical protein